MIMPPPTKLYDNFRPQKILQTFITPPYYPDLSPPDYLMFPKLKMKLKGLHFADVAEIQEAVTDELKKVQREELFGSFSENARPYKSLYICQWSLFFLLKKGYLSYSCVFNF
jgi:hypothetical protein